MREMASPESAAHAGLFLGMGMAAGRQAGRAVVVPGRERMARREKAKSHRRERKEELRMADIQVCRGFSLSNRSTMPQRDHRTCRCRDVHGTYRPSLLILEEITFPDPLDNCENLCSGVLLAILLCATG